MRNLMNHLMLFVTVAVAIVSCQPDPVFATVSNTTVSTTTMNGDGSTTNFAIGFDFRSNSWLTVTEFDTSTTPVTVTVIPQGAGAGKYTVSGGNPGTTVVMGTAPTTTQYLVITRTIPLTQTVAFIPSAPFPYSGLSGLVDQMTLELQNLNAGIGGSSGGGGGGGGGSGATIPFLANNFIGWGTGSSSTINIPGNQSTFNKYDMIEWNGSAWAVQNLSAANILGFVNNNAGSLAVSPGAGGTGTTTNNGTLSWGNNNLAFTLTGNTSLTLPTSGSLIAGTTNSGNVANTIAIRDGSGNSSFNQVTANQFNGPLVGNVTGNVTGNTSGTAANVTGVVAIGNGGTGQSTQQAALNAIAGGTTAGNFIRCNGTNCGLNTLQIGDVPQGFSRAKLAQGTHNTVITNDNSGNLFDLATGPVGQVLTSNGISPIWAPAGTGIPGIFPYGADTGAANAYVVATPNPPVITYAAGIGVSFVAGNSNTGAATINVSSLGVQNIIRGDGSALQANDILAGEMVVVEYDGSNFQLLNPYQWQASGSPVVTFTVNTTATTVQNKILMNCGSNCTLTLPLISTLLKPYTFQVENIGSTQVTVQGSGADNVNSGASATIYFQYQSFTLLPTSNGWFII